MSTLSPELTECIEAIYETFRHIEATLDRSKSDHVRFLAQMDVLNDQFEAVRRGGAA